VTIDAAQLWSLNHRLVTVVLHARSKELDALGLETKEFFVLDEVGTSPYPAELADRLMIPRASVTAYVRNLVAKGFMRREIDEADLRRHRLALTKHGEEALAGARGAVAAEFESRLARVGERDRSHLQRTLMAMLAPGADD
jgi:DNA-binding MarR family transcriptional regulator